jgi:hypothetical protein
MESDHASAVEDDHALRERADELHVVLDEHHRQPLLREHSKRLDQSRLLAGTQARGGLVE